MANVKHPFVGNFRVSIDAKQRIAMPKTMRDTLVKSYGEEADSVIVTLAMRQPSIAVYPLSEFNRLMDRLQETTELDADTQSLLMLMSASARACPIDGQGRIRLPEDLMAHAGLEKEAYFCGHITRMQIWQPERWKQFASETLGAMSEVTVRAFESIRKA